MRKKTKSKRKNEIRIMDSKEYKKTAPEKQIMTSTQLEKLLSTERKMDLEIEKALLELKDNYSTLLIVSPKNYNDAILALFRRFVGAEKKEGIYIAVNKSYERLAEEMEGCNIDIQKVVIIDMITKMTGAAPVKAGNVYYLESANDLMELTILLEKRLKKMNGKNKFIILDSISTLLIYNNSAEIEKLIHSLIEKINKFKANGIFVVVESGEYYGTIQTISQFCDRVAKISETAISPK